MDKSHIFFLEDDQNFGAVLKSYLELNDFIVDWCTDGKDAMDRFSEADYDLCILDVMLPNTDGFTVGKNIRKRKPEIPFVFLSARNMKEDILTGYRAGADDYITKPFDTEVLLFKIKAILNRKRAPELAGQNENKIGDYTFNESTRTLRFHDQEQKLSPKESALLKLLFQNKNELLKREFALESIWGERGYFTARSMDVYLSKLRKYLANDPRIEIKTVHGTGFILSINDDN